ncbi:CsbD family protein [Paenibacillus piri]|uniref:CsbD family protein n=1 Tax=Paenibacillus piri TaxID=2547395 RepID=A0A4R5KHH9_9BACL|nr:CsbD family protein [Paenibacillus piri]TDF94863.1 CsbD family protein [Paenibacillus piri]
MYSTVFRSRWKRVKSKAKEQWGTDIVVFDDMDLYGGSPERRPGKFHKRYSREAVERDYKEWYSHH